MGVDRSESPGVLTDTSCSYLVGCPWRYLLGVHNSVRLPRGWGYLTEIRLVRQHPFSPADNQTGSVILPSWTTPGFKPLARLTDLSRPGAKVLSFLHPVAVDKTPQHGKASLKRETFARPSSPSVIEIHEVQAVDKDLRHQ